MKIICIGGNYLKHIEELNSKKTTKPILFLKPDTAKLSDKTPFVIPPFSKNIHYEIEVLVKIKKIGKYIQPKFAYKYYDEIGLGIDFTARDVQKKCKKNGHPWEKAKAFDGSAVIGKFYPKEDFNMNNISFKLLKNNEIVQNGNTNNMIWKIDELISYASEFFTLKTGDVIFTGTPEGVGTVQENDVLAGIIGEKKAFEVRVK